MSIEIFLSVIILSSVVFGLAVVYLIVRKQLAGKNLKIAEESAKRILDDAKREAETKRKKLIIEAKEKKVKMLKDAEREPRRTERRLEQKEENIEKKDSAVTEREKKIEAQENKLKEKSDSLDLMKAELEKLRTQETEKLEKVAQLSREEAKKLLLDNVEKSSRQEAGAILRKVEEETKKEAEKKSREILATAIQRCAVDHVVETTTSLVELPSDDMKGRIIGREGRNIRAFETATGVDLIVDDTPEAVILSSFNPLRREVARLTLKKLIADGRIHPARVEETYKKAEQEIKAAMLEYGEQAALDTNVQGLPAVMIQLLGRLHYRTSYGQNVLQHSIEMSHLAGNLAAELGVNVNLAKRAALLHDIGKAVDQEAEGTHVKLGVMLAKKAGESIEVLHAMEAHHGDVETRTIEAVIVQACDAISAARPGARRDSLEAYVKRLEKLETVAKSFSGVEKCFAIQAGREVRVMVEPDVIDDTMAVKLAHDIAKKIEAELEYPGEVRVTVVREIRASDIAR